jgi:hypothetical protein
LPREGLPKHGEHQSELVDFVGTFEQRAAGEELGEQSTRGEHIHTEAVVSTAQQNLWGAVPKRDHLRSHASSPSTFSLSRLLLLGGGQRSRKPKVPEAHGAAVVVHVLGLDVTVAEPTSGVKEVQRDQQIRDGGAGVAKRKRLFVEKRSEIAAALMRTADEKGAGPTRVFDNSEGWN